MKRILCLVLAALSLSGCAARGELALMAVCLGADVSAEGVTLTVKCPDFTGKDEAGGGYAIYSASGSDWTRAVAALYAACPSAPQFSQLREIVIGEESFQWMPPERLLALIDQLPGVRVHALATVSAVPAADLVDQLMPEIGKRLSKYLDVSLRHYEEQGVIPATSLSCALRDVSGPWRDPVLAYTDGAEEVGGYALGTAGGLRLSREEIQLYRLLQGEKSACLLEYGGRYYGAAGRGPIRKRVSGDALLLELPVSITYSLADERPAPGAEAALEDRVRALVEKLQAAGCDALGFGCRAARDYATLPDWLASGWPDRYRALSLRVEISAQYRQQPVL